LVDLLAGRQAAVAFRRLAQKELVTRDLVFAHGPRLGEREVQPETLANEKLKPLSADGEAARAAGADVVGFEDLAEQIKQGNINFDVAIATPASMRIVGQLGQILGPRGLMPNPKVGTVTPDVAGAVRNAKAGQVRYRTDKAGIVHCPLGKASFEVSALKENFEAILGDLRKAKPSTSKGIYLRQITISCTMGPGIPVDRASVESA
jgi:large subunit ribosomal protein L1